VPERIRDIKEFIRAIIYLFDKVSRLDKRMFRDVFYHNMISTLEDSAPRLYALLESPYISNPEEFPEIFEEIQSAGLYGIQLELKLESFEVSFLKYQDSEDIEDLKEALDKGSVILSSLGGAIPGIGSFAQEFIDFLLKEIKKRKSLSVSLLSWLTSLAKGRS
jgi:hypothetical protein